MYETYSAFKSYGDFYSFVNRLHININNSRANVGKAEREYQECVKNEGYSIHKSSILLDTLWRERFVLQALEEIETVLFSSLSEDAKNEMDRICKETDYHLESVRKAG